MGVDRSSSVSEVYVVTEDAGYDIGCMVRGVFSTRQKAEAWIEARRAEYASQVRDGKAAAWGGPTYDVEEYQLDPVEAP